MVDELIFSILNLRPDLLGNLNGDIKFQLTNIEHELIRSGKIRLNISQKTTNLSEVLFNIGEIGQIETEIKYKEEGLIVLGVPSNSFNQEKSNEKDVKDFCEVNFNINFPMTKITEVKGDNAHEIFKWAKKNHGSSSVPKWNFHKILINKDGKIEDTFTSFTNPMSNKITSKIESLL